MFNIKPLSIRGHITLSDIKMFLCCMGIGVVLAMVVVIMEGRV